MSAAPVVSKVAEGLHRIDTFVTGTRMPLAMYLVEGVGPVESDAAAPFGWLLTDTGCVGMVDALVLPTLERLDPGAVVSTGVVCHAHADHFGGNAELVATNPACRLYAHEDDVAWARDPDVHVREAYDRLEPEFPTPADAKVWVAGLLGPPTPVTALVEGDRFPLKDGSWLRVLALPGHSPGHIGLWNEEHGVLLASDAILGDGQRAEGRLDAIPSYLDVAAYLGSVRTIRDLGVELLCTAHFPLMRGDEVRAFCDLSEDFVHRLERAVQAALGRGDGKTVRQLTDEVVPLVAQGVTPSVAAGFSVQAHLDALLGRGLARIGMRGGKRVWNLA